MSGVPSEALPAELASLFGFKQSTALPVQRVEVWLEQIEERCRRAQASIEENWPALEAELEEARTAYETLEAESKRAKSPPNKRVVLKALRAYCNASNALRPPLWMLSQEGLRNAHLLRERLADGNAAEAVEAALRAMNAVWKLQSKQLEKPMEAALKGYASWSKGGTKKAKLQREKLAGRNEQIAHARAAMVAAGETSEVRMVAMLADRFGLSKKQLKRILSQSDMC